MFNQPELFVREHYRDGAIIDTKYGINFLLVENPGTHRQASWHFFESIGGLAGFLREVISGQRVSVADYQNTTTFHNKASPTFATSIGEGGGIESEVSRGFSSSELDSLNAYLTRPMASSVPK